LADAMLDAAALKELLAKKWYGPPRAGRLAFISRRSSA